MTKRTYVSEAAEPGRSGHLPGLWAELTEEQDAMPRQYNRAVFWDLGYIAPEQVTGYECKNCGIVDDAPPKVKAYISENTDGISARIWYDCCKCGEQIVGSTIPRPLIGTIPLEVITMDKTGTIIRPTPEMIEEQLRSVEESAAKGEMLHFWHGAFDVISTWSKVIGYELPQDRLDQMKVTCIDAYVQRMIPEIPALVGRILENEYCFDRKEDEHGYTLFMGLSDDVEILLGVLPFIPIPEDMELCADIDRILSLYAGMQETEAERLRREAQELSRQADNIGAYGAEQRGAHFAWRDRVPGLRSIVVRENPEGETGRLFEPLDGQNEPDGPELNYNDCHDPPF